MSENRLLHLEDFSGGEVIELGLGCLGPEQDPPQVTAPMGLSGHSWLRHCCCSEALHQRRANDAFLRAPCQGGAFQWVRDPPGDLAPAGSNRSRHGGDEMSEAFD